MDDDRVLFELDGDELFELPLDEEALVSSPLGVSVLPFGESVR